MRRRNIIAGSFLIAMAVGYGVLASQLPARTLPNTPDPSFFPWINTVILLVLSAALLGQGLLTPADDGEPAPPARFADGAWLIATLIAYLVVLPGLGFLVASVPFFGALMVLFGERRPLWLVAGGVAVPLLLFVLFRYGLRIFLPLGVLQGLVP